MAVKIEKGGWIFIFLIGAGLVAYSLDKYDIVNLFGNFFPIVLSIMKQLPIIGTVLNTPMITRMTDRAMGVLPGVPRD